MGVATTSIAQASAIGGQGGPSDLLLDQRFSTRASPLDGETRFFFFVLENHLKNGLESPLIFSLF